MKIMVKIFTIKSDAVKTMDDSGHNLLLQTPYWEVMVLVEMWPA